MNKTKVFFSAIFCDDEKSFLGFNFWWHYICVVGWLGLLYGANIMDPDGTKWSKTYFFFHIRNHMRMLHTEKKKKQVIMARTDDKLCRLYRTGAAHVYF